MFVLLTLSIVMAPRAARATTIPFDFESFAEFDMPTDLGDGVTLGHAVVLASYDAGVLNELDFPPHSGINLVSDADGPLTIDLAMPYYGVSGYVTYNVPLTFDFFDSANTLLASLTSRYFTNIGTFGDFGSTPNELFTFSSQTPIARVVIAGAPTGGSFVLDDLALENTPVPEPATLTMMLGGVAVLARRRWRSGERA
jgi:hypothetical protein